jgi:3-hydroxybutyryl-CoA dehydrogenase
MKIGILGSGAMGSGIAQVAATAGHEVVMYDKNAAALDKALKGLIAVHDKLVEKGKLTRELADTVLGRIGAISDYGGFEDCGMVIEAIVEDLSIKKTVFEELEKHVDDDCVLATNTSSLSVASIASACTKPERVIGIHFFNPPALMPLVEIIPAIQTDQTVVTTSRDLINSWKKVTVLAKDTPGFIVNRVARPFYGEALRIYEEGIAGFATIDWAMTHLGGFRMGPFTLMDFIGNDVNYKVTESVFEAFYYDPRYKPSFTQRRLSEAGWYGRKTGRGYYDYSEGAVMPEPVQDAALGAYIFERILVMLINEAADAVFMHVASAQDIDLAMTNGVNYPKGLLQWADEVGIAWVVEKLDALYHEYHEDRYRCSPLLRRMAAQGRLFFAAAGQTAWQ